MTSFADQRPSAPHCLLGYLGEGERKCVGKMVVFEQHNHVAQSTTFPNRRAQYYQQSDLCRPHTQAKIELLHLHQLSRPCWFPPSRLFRLLPRSLTHYEPRGGNPTPDLVDERKRDYFDTAGLPSSLCGASKTPWATAQVT